MICPKCNGDVSDEDIFCMHCGARLQEPALEEAEPDREGEDGIEEPAMQVPQPPVPDRDVPSRPAGWAPAMSETAQPQPPVPAGTAMSQQPGNSAPAPVRRRQPIWIFAVVAVLALALIAVLAMLAVQIIHGSRAVVRDTEWGMSAQQVMEIEASREDAGLLDESYLDEWGVLIYEDAEWQGMYGDLWYEFDAQDQMISVTLFVGPGSLDFDAIVQQMDDRYGPGTQQDEESFYWMTDALYVSAWDMGQDGAMVSVYPSFELAEKLGLEV